LFLDRSLGRAGNAAKSFLIEAAFIRSKKRNNKPETTVGIKNLEKLNKPTFFGRIIAI